MEVHAHTHTVRKKWTHYLWEFFMMFLAVTLGFLVENQREHYVEHQRLIRFAKQLVNGLERDTLNQNGVLEYLEIKETTFDSLLYFLAMPKDDAEKWIGIYKNVSILENPFRYTYQKPVFDQISSSGSFRLFENEKIIDSLFSYIYNGTIIEWQTNAEIEYMTSVIIPFMNTHFDKNLMEQRFETYIKKPSWNTSMIGHTLPPGFLEHVGEWKQVFENIVITAREKHEPAFLNILGEREKARVLISSLKKEFRLK